MPRDDAIAERSWVGDRFLRLRLGEPTPGAIAAACERLARAAIPGLLDVTPARETLLLVFDMRALAADTAESRVCEALRGLTLEGDVSAARAPIDIPVCYGGEFGPDLVSVASMHGTTAHDAARAHAAAMYTVEFIGFSPGFPYLVGLPANLATPRLAKPRPRVAPGSVAIADDRTGVYPSATPGGWRVIGRTPLRLFDPTREPPSLLRAGDRVRFAPITEAEFRAHAERGA